MKTDTASPKVPAEPNPSKSLLPLVSSPRRVVYVVLAGLFFGLGMLGVILPGLPTTPFLLLTSYLLARSWPALNRRMLESRFVGGILRDWQEHRGVRPHVKFKSLGVVACAVGATVYWGSLPTPVLIVVLALVAVGVTVVLRLPSIRD